MGAEDTLGPPRGPAGVDDHGSSVLPRGTAWQRLLLHGCRARGSISTRPGKWQHWDSQFLGTGGYFPQEFLGGDEQSALGVLDHVLQLGHGVLPVQGHRDAPAHPRRPLGHHVGGIIGAEKGDPLFLQVPAGTLQDPADLPGQAEAPAEQVPVRVLPVLVNDGHFVPKGQSSGEHGGDVTAAGGPGCVQSPVGTASPLAMPCAAGQVPEEAAEGPAQLGEEQGEQHPASTEVILQKAMMGADQHGHGLPRGLFPSRESGSPHLNNIHSIIYVPASECHTLGSTRIPVLCHNGARGRDPSLHSLQSTTSR